MSDTLLRVEDLKIYYPVAGSGFGKKEFVKAVDGVTFEVKKGEVFGIVGESGCGKSTLGRGVCKLENLTSGHVYLDGEDITEYNDRRMRSIRLSSVHISCGEDVFHIGCISCLLSGCDVCFGI